MNVTRSIVNITDAAELYITNILQSNPGKSLKVGYDNKGCSGHKYTFELIDQDVAKPLDEKIQIKNGTVIIPSENLLGLIGSTLDLVVDQFEQYLIWKNPLAVNQCGCGESFQLAGESSCKN